MLVNTFSQDFAFESRGIITQIVILTRNAVNEAMFLRVRQTSCC